MFKNIVKKPVCVNTPKEMTPIFDFVNQEQQTMKKDKKNQINTEKVDGWKNKDTTLSIDQLKFKEKTNSFISFSSIIRLVCKSKNEQQT